jgi:hypothetical protein
MFGRQWAKAQAKVIDYNSRADNLTGGRMSDYVVDVMPADEPPFRATFRHRRWNPSSNFAAPSMGDVVGVLFDPKSHEVKFDTSDPQLSLRARARSTEQGDEERLRQVAEAPPGTPPPDGS